MRYATASLLLCCFFAACTDTQDLGDRPGENDGGAKDASTSTDAAADTANLPDSTAADSGEDAGNEAGVWSPKQLAGLELWLDSSNGVVADLAKPGFATKWLDQSGKGHDATAIPSNNTLPKIQAAGLAAKNTVRCEAQPYFEITDAPGLHLGMGDWGIVMVAKFTYDSGQGGPVLFMKNGGLRIDVNGSGNVVLAAGSGTAAVANVPPSTFHIMSMRGTKLEVRGR